MKRLETIDQESMARYQATTEFIYGEQTWGPLFAEGDGSPIPFTDNSAAPYIAQSLKILGLSNTDLAKLRVLNIGSGREAMIFQQLGAAHVTLLDIAKGNIENTGRWVREKGLTNVSMIYADIERTQLRADQYDLIFLAGVYQHIQTPAKALIHLARALTPGGKMYLGFYRSGEWKYFIVDAVRHLITRELFACLKRKIALSCSFGNPTHYQMARMLDDFFVPCMHKFRPRDVIHDAGLVGLGVWHFDNDFREYHHEGQGYFSIGGDRIYFVKESTPAAIPPIDRFKTVRGLNQLVDVPYEEPLIRDNLQLIETLRTYIEHRLIPPDDVAVLAINLYRFTRPFEPERDEYYQRSLRDGRHRTLNEYLSHVVRLYG